MLEIKYTNRWYILLIFWLFYLVFNVLFRIFLYAYSDFSEEISLLVLSKILTIGALYDTAFYSYATIPLLLLLVLIPPKIFNGRWIHLLGVLALCLTMFGIIFISISEWVFWEEFEARFNFIAVDYLVYTQEVSQNIRESYNVMLLLVIAAVLSLVLSLVLYRRYFKKIHCQQKFMRRLGIATALLAVPFLSYLILDQDLKSFDFDRQAMEISGNGPYQFFAAFRNNELSFSEYYLNISDSDARRMVSKKLAVSNVDASNPLLREVRSANPENNYNVVLVSIESLSASFLGRYGNTQALTPNLDKMVAESLTFDKMYATGTRTTRGLEAITLSIPPVPGRSLVKRPAQPPRFNISTEFQKRGYDVAYFYGGNGYFDNMNQFFSHNGYRIVDKSNLKKEEYSLATAWGVADEFMFDRLIREADDSSAHGQPFMYHLMTTSNHRPYTFPEGHIDLEPGHRTSAVKYTDWAIGDFIHKASSKSWFDSTIFIFVADHTARAYGKTDLDPNGYHIPAFIYAPKIVPAKAVQTLVGQIDIAPTLLGLMDFSYLSTFFGRDINVVDENNGRAFIGTYQLLGLLKQDDTMVYLKPDKTALGRVAASTSPKNSILTKNSKAVQELVAFYQVADDALKNGWINRAVYNHVSLRK